MTEELKVIISASVDELQNACKQAENDVNDLQTNLSGNGEKIKSAFSAIGTGIATATAAVSAAAVGIGKSLYDMASKTAAYGDTIDKNSQRVGLSYESYQKWDYAMQLAGTSMSSCTNGLKSLTNKIDDALSGSETATDQFAALGMSIEDLEGKSREDIFAATITALQGVEDETTKAALANDIFGKSGQELIPLLNMTSEDLDKVMKECEDYGMVMSDEAVVASAAFQDSLTKLQGSLSGVKNSLASEMLPSITEIMDGLSGMIVGVEGAEEAFTTGIEHAISAISSALPRFLEAGVLVIEGIINGITKTLPQLFTTVTKLIIDVIELVVSNMPNIIEAVMNGINSLLTAISQSLPKLLNAVVDALLKIVNTIIKQLPQFLDAFLELMLSFVDAILKSIPQIVAALPELINNIVNFILGSIPQLIEAGVDLLTSLIDNLPTIITTICDALPQIIEGIITTLLNNIPSIIQAGVDLLTSLIDNLPTIITTILTAIPKIISNLVNTFANNIPLIVDAGVKLLVSLVKNLPQIIAQVIKAIPQIITALVRTIGDGTSSIVSAGYNLVVGLFSGISNAVSWLYGKLRGWVSNVLSYVKSLFGIHSPSKVFAGYGDFIVQGLGGGIEDATHYATDAVNDLAASVEKAFNPSLEIPRVENDGIDISSIDTIKNRLILDTNSGYQSNSATADIAEDNQPIQLIVNDKVLAETVITCINRLTKQTGNLGLVIA